MGRPDAQSQPTELDACSQECQSETYAFLTQRLHPLFDFNCLGLSGPGGYIQSRGPGPIAFHNKLDLYGFNFVSPAPPYVVRGKEAYCNDIRHEVKSVWH